MLSNDQARKLVDQVLSYSKADNCEVRIGAGDAANIRFANNSVTTSGRQQRIALRISSTFDARTGSVATNETSAEALKGAVARSEELAKLAPPDPEYVEPLGAQKYPQIEGFDQRTADSGAKELAEAVRATIEGAAAKKLESSGFLEREASAYALGNKKGNFGYTTLTDYNYTTTVRTPDGTGSGWALSAGHELGAMDSRAVARVAIDKAILSQKPRKLDPGRYTVILEPAAVEDLVLLLFGGGFDARAADEGRSVMSKKGGGTRVGEKMFSDRITVRSDPFDIRIPTVPWYGGISTQLAGVGQFFFGGGGGGGASFLPVERRTWVEKGVVKGLSYSRYWAKQKNTAPTGPASWATIIHGEDHSLDDLIKSTERGLLITHFFYIRFVQPQTQQYTGLTRDGVFMIENGQIAYPVNNFRWNESPVNVLANAEMLSRPVRTERAIVPAIKTHDFNMASVSDAI
ncbi:MAG TPA: TldD/PmbA family protein [Terriglobales bacterium]|nr:TldD/PmbA family protein [Terriglobales bacterium]